MQEDKVQSKKVDQIYLNNMGYTPKTNDVIHLYQKAVKQRHRDPSLPKDLVAKAFVNPTDPGIKQGSKTLKNAVARNGTIYNQFFSPNPEASPALPPPKNLFEQVKTLDQLQKNKNQSMTNLVERNVREKQREDHRRQVAEQERRREVLASVQANNVVEKQNLANRMLQIRKEEADSADKEALDEKHRYHDEIQRNKLNRR